MVYPSASTRALLAIAIFVPAALSQVSRCAPCHAQIAAGFQNTGMGRSFSPVHPETFPGKPLFGKPYYHEASDTWYTMLERGGRIFQRRWQLGFNGKETNVEEKQVDF